VTLIEVGFLAVFWLWAVSAALFLRNTVLPKVPIAFEPSQLGLASETVSFPSTDGVRLEGWKIPADPSAPWIILCHGLGTNRADLLETGAGLHRRGFNAFLFDFRGHGGSEGRTTSFGRWEQRDLEGALAFLGRQPDVAERPYGIYGISMGGSVAIMVAARDERIGAVAADSPYLDLDDSLARHLELLYRLPQKPFLWFVRLTYRLRFGVWPSQVSPASAIPALGTRPMLLIQGAEDVRMPVTGAQKLLEAARGPKQLWIIQGAGHLEGFRIDQDVYLDRVGSFFRSALGGLVRYHPEAGE
jgi:alpha-beta hydrolase superfamily lysophospholipase